MERCSSVGSVWDVQGGCWFSGIGSGVVVRFHGARECKAWTNEPEYVRGGVEEVIVSDKTGVRRENDKRKGLETS